MTQAKTKFAVFILTHGRASDVRTYKALKRCGYKGPIYLLIDNEDKQREEYEAKYKKKVIVFDKAKTALRVDTADNFPGRKAIVYARNEVFVIAKEMGLTHFAQLDDDYNTFYYKVDENLNYKNTQVKNLTKIWLSMVKFLDVTKADSVAMAQGGDFIGGENGGYSKKPKLHHKCMNTWVCSVARPIDFIGKMNEDMTTSIRYGHLGKLYLTFPQIAMHPLGTQVSAGGMSDLYSDTGTYVKTFYSILYCPSFTKVGLMGTTHKRLHHKVNWNNAVPKILHESYKKK